MKIYMVEVESTYTGNVKVSQEGYKSIEGAKRFIISRYGWGEEIEEINPMCYKIGRYIYNIREISII